MKIAKLPRVLISIYRARPDDRPFLKIRRLYQGYMGAYWINRLFVFTLWID